MPNFKLVYTTADDEVARWHTTSDSSDAIEWGLKILKSDRGISDMGVLFIMSDSCNFEPLCSLCPKTNQSVPFSPNRQLCRAVVSQEGTAASSTESR